MAPVYLQWRLEIELLCALLCQAPDSLCCLFLWIFLPGDELVDHLSAIATTVTKEVMSWLTRTPLLWPCTSGFRKVWEDGGTLHSGHAISFILTCMQTQTSHDILQFSFSVSPLPLGSLLTDILCRGTSGNWNTLGLKSCRKRRA